MIFTDKNNCPLVTLHFGMSDDLRGQLLDAYRTVFPDRLQHVNTSEDTANTSCGQFLHLDWYNRYSMHVST